MFVNTPIENDIVNLTPEQLRDPEARKILVDDLVDAGLYDRGTAEFVVEILRKEAAGEPVPGGMREYLAKHRSLMAEIAKLRSERDAQIEKAARVAELERQAGELQVALDLDRTLLANLQASVSDEHVAREYIEIQRIKGFSTQNATELGKGLAGIKDIIGVLERAVIPFREAQLAEKLAEKAKILEAQPA